MSVRIRSATPADREWILEHASRLHDFGPPPLRAREVMDAAVRDAIAGGLDGAPGAAVMVAEVAGERRGFLHMQTVTDFFTGEPHAHVSDIVVVAGAEGTGVGRALLEAGESWAREQGYRLVTLNVFAGNTRARAVYEHAGYAVEMSKMLKVL